ncbi:MAG: hypothetical protein AAGC64_00975 [Bacteroidota bacterium]
MKKLIFAFALIASIGFTGCSSDDDSAPDINSVDCNILGLVPVTFVDNGDGTATVTVDGESETVDLGGIDFQTYTDQICSGDLELDLGF